MSCTEERFTTIEDALRDLDAAEKSHATIHLDRRRYGKPVTIVEGLEDRRDLDEIVSRLKSQLATGGSVKEGRIELQGDHVRRISTILAAMGIQADVAR